MKTFRFFSMAAVALMMGACSVEDNAVEEQAQEPANGRIRFEATIAAPDAGARTRTTYGANSDGDITSVEWKYGDQIALIHGGKKDVVSVNSVDGSGNATITGDITAPTGEEEDVVLVYPAASVTESGTPDKTYSSTYGLAQDGTFGYISQYLDARRATGKIIKSGTKGTLKSSVKLVSEIAIWRLKLSDGTNPFSATKVTLKLGGVTIAGTKTLSTATNDIYLCVVPKTLTDIYTAMPGAVFTIEATVGTNNYIYGKTTTLSLATNTYYVSNPVTLAGPFTMAADANSPTDLGKLICTAGHIHAYGADADCKATRVALITYVGSGTGDATYTHGLAFALEDMMSSSIFTWGNSGSNNGGKTAAELCSAWNTSKPVANASWMLPSMDQWNNMVNACKNVLGTQNSFKDLRNGFSSRGGTDLNSVSYWSSTEYDANATHAWYYDIGNGNWHDISKTFNGFRVRACLAF